MSGELPGPLLGTLAPVLAGLAVLVWPARSGGRVRQLGRTSAADASRLPSRVGFDRAPGPEPVAVLGFSRSRGRAAAGLPLALAPDLVMALVAAGLRGGLSVVDALGCALASGGGPVSTPTLPSARGRSSRSGSGRSGSGRSRSVPGRSGSGSAHQGLAGPMRTSWGWSRLGGGGPRGDPAAYLAVVVARLRAGVPAEQAWLDPPEQLEPLARALVLAELSGAPAAEVVARAARDARTRARERVELGAARLGVRLVLPLGLAVLPGFVLLAVAPIVLGLATSVLRPGG